MKHQPSYLLSLIDNILPYLLGVMFLPVVDLHRYVKTTGNENIAVDIMEKGRHKR